MRMIQHFRKTFVRWSSELTSLEFTDLEKNRTFHPFLRQNERKFHSKVAIYRPVRPRSVVVPGQLVPIGARSGIPSQMCRTKKLKLLRQTHICVNPQRRITHSTNVVATATVQIYVSHKMGKYLHFAAMAELANRFATPVCFWCGNLQLRVQVAKSCWKFCLKSRIFKISI